MLSLLSEENELGSQLAGVAAAQRISDLTFSYSCPSCGSKLRIIRSRASGKRFIGCEGYQNGCRFTLPLPQFGRLTITPRNCKACGFQMIMVRSKARRPLISCPRCYATKSKDKSQLGKSAVTVQTTASV
jgi:ssDNA-binding Zn-finger/Zn-ribbon topoisomerase 1